ncbi:MAG: HRDC domain-containing protein [Dehalococcoidia bacterium]
MRHLPALYDLLREALVAAGRLEEAEEEFARISRVTPEERAFDPDGFWRIRGARDLAPAGRAALRELYVLRDARARALDHPPVRVIRDETLLAIAQLRPRDAVGLRRAGLSPLQVDRYGSAVLAALGRADGAPPPLPPRGGSPPDPRIVRRYDALRAWRKDQAAARDVEPEIIVSNAVLRALASSNVATAEEVVRVAELAVEGAGLTPSRCSMH